MTSYWRSIVTMTISCHFWDIQHQKISRAWNHGQGSIKVIESGTIHYTGYGFLLVFCSNFVPKTHHFDFDFKMLWPWKPGRGPWRSLKMLSFDRVHMTSYWRSIVTMALSLVVSEIFSVKKISRPWNHGQGSLKITESGTRRYTGYGFLLVFYSTFVPKFLRHSTSNMPWPWKPGWRSIKVIVDVTIQ